ncbi:uncharacterized protein LY89DRAFT_435620 [Mollisia scopiformis]|uniref:Uncharacterized protein n=1 Tax=Mollisia scopiformis TaxID=149040 RepID=A0A194XMI3_MOLSC|nr:uncharacterized protein LY89DRAFT_435620 [Mollisia scopiformis]KUJ21465.1 hypothetical protein LY89DRAFT_435620 [Mollisia scopiformis]
MSQNRNQPPSHDGYPQSSNKIIEKMNKFVADHCQLYTRPPPLPGFSWASIDKLEASLLVSVVATTTRLHQIIQASADSEPQFLATTNECMKRYVEIMIPAGICCSALNNMRDGKFRGNLAVIEAVLTAFHYVKEKHNPILPDFKGSLEESRNWILACRMYVENAVMTMKHAALALKSTGSI